MSKRWSPPHCIEHELGLACLCHQMVSVPGLFLLALETCFIPTPAFKRRKSRIHSLILGVLLVHPSPEAKMSDRLCPKGGEGVRKI